MNDQEQQQELDRLCQMLYEAIPHELIETRKGPGNTMLSYVGHPIIKQRLNDAFRQRWSSTSESKMHHFDVRNDACCVFVEVKVRITVTLPNGEQVWREGISCEMQTGRMSDVPANAVKNAESDAFKRAAMQFGPYLGLDLWKSDVMLKREGKLSKQAQGVAGNSVRSVPYASQPKAAPQSMPAPSFNPSILDGIDDFLPLISQPPTKSQKSPTHQ
jgi:recombination DNA repair RAD52 pathway protein